MNHKILIIMKTTLLILALCLFSFSSESLKQSENSNLQQADKDNLIRIRHYVGSENGPKQYIEFDAPFNAWKGHAKHEEDCYQPLNCEPPACFCIHPTEPPVPPPDF